MSKKPGAARTLKRFENRKAENAVQHVLHIYEVRPRKDHRGIDLISDDALPFGRLWYAEPNAVSNAIGYAKFRRRSHHAVIRVFDEARQRGRD